MLDVIKLFRDHDTRDELGIGTIRDAIADYFFPGTTTIQTRARYFLFVPWIYQRTEKKLANKGWSRSRIQEDLEYWERRLIGALIAGKEGNGVIGIEARQKLLRLPANVYWAGLGRLGIRRLSGSQSDFYRYLSRVSAGHSFAAISETILTSQEHDEGDQKSTFSAWHPGLPPAPSGFLDKTTHDLTRREAEFLRERIVQGHRRSLFAAFMLRQADGLDVSFPWQHPILDALNPELQTVIGHAKNFSESLHGAVLLYNLMLAEKLGNDDWVEDYQDSLHQWADKVSDRWSEIAAWGRDTSAFWLSPPLEGARIPHRTKVFVNRWLATAAAISRPHKLASNAHFRDLIRSRELSLKGGKRARLHSAEALARWRGQSGTSQLDFRWKIAGRILADIHQGLKRRSEPDA